jgi:chromosome partitioning protein
MVAGMAQIISIANLKGGVSKSVLSTNLACALRSVGKVVIADTDNQQSSVWWSRKASSGVEVIAARQDGDKRAWARLLAGLDAELIIIDCGSNDPDGLGAAFAVSTLTVIPCPASGVDIKATRDTIDVLRVIRKRRGGLPPALLVPSRVDRRRASGREIEAALHDFGEPVAPAIMERAAFSDAFTAGMWVGEFAPRSAGQSEVEALANIVRRRLWPQKEPA